MFPERCDISSFASVGGFCLFLARMNENITWRAWLERLIGKNFGFPGGASKIFIFLVFFSQQRFSFLADLAEALHYIVVSAALSTRISQAESDRRSDRDALLDLPSTTAASLCYRSVPIFPASLLCVVFACF